MDLAERVAEIDRLNDEGIKLSRPPTLDESFVKHSKAAELAENSFVNPEYVCFSRANMGYVLRQQGQYQDATELLEEVLHWSKDIFEERKMPKSYGARGRVAEELGLIYRDNPDGKESSLQTALAYLNEALEVYTLALSNSVEIYTDEKIQQRINRTTGIKGWTLALLSQTDAEYRDEALKYAKTELTSRLKAGETEGHGLANAHHTVGLVITSFVSEDPELYVQAREHLLKAQELTPQERTKTTIDFRLAWLSYLGNEDTQVVRDYLDSFLDNNTVLSTTDINSIRDPLLQLGDVLGETYQSRIATLTQ